MNSACYLLLKNFTDFYFHILVFHLSACPFLGVFCYLFLGFFLWLPKYSVLMYKIKWRQCLWFEREAHWNWCVRTQCFCLQQTCKELLWTKRFLQKDRMELGFAYLSFDALWSAEQTGDASCVSPCWRLAHYWKKHLCECQWESEQQKELEIPVCFITTLTDRLSSGNSCQLPEVRAVHRLH